MCREGGDCQGKRGRFIDSAMSDDEKKKRLAEALRANLRRRKAQAREAEPSARPVLGADSAGDEKRGG